MSWVCSGSTGFRRAWTRAYGAYVRYAADELLAIITLESQRARAVVVGEDLGTVEEGVQERLAAHRLLVRIAFCGSRPIHPHAIRSWRWRR